MGYLGNGLTITGTQNSKRIVVDATPNQTISTVTGGYLVGQLDVFRNGVKLVDTQDYTASDGSIVTLLAAASEGDELEFVVFENFNVASALSKSGGSLNGDLVVTGIATFNSDVSIGGTLTYEDVTNIDSVGLITARSGVEIGTPGIAATLTAAGGAVFTGIITTSSGLDVNTVAGETNDSNVVFGARASNGAHVVSLTLKPDRSATFDGGVGIADSIFHIGDDNTAIRFPSADTFTVETAGSEAIRVTSAGRVGIGTDVPGATLHVHGPTGDAGQIYVTDGDAAGVSNSFLISKGGTTTTLKDRQASSNIDFGTADTHAVRIDSSQRVIIGSSNNNVNNDALQVNTAGGSNLGVSRFSNNTGGPDLFLYKSRNTTPGSHTAVADGDVLGQIRFSGDDGSDYVEGCRLFAKVNGAVSTNTVTTDLVFGSGTTGTERLRITSAGNVGIGTTIPGEILHAVGDAIFGSGCSGRTQSFADGIHVQPTSGNGTVAIGLAIGNDGSGSGTGSGIRLGAGNATSTTAASIEGIFNGTGTSLIIRTTDSYGVNAAAERFKVEDGGKTVITGGASEQLRVKGTEADIWLESTGPTGVWRILGSSGQNTHKFRVYDNTNSRDLLNIIGASKTYQFNNGPLVENGEVTSTAASGTQNIDLFNGMVLYRTTNSSGTWKPNFRVNGSISVNSIMGTGDVISPTLIIQKGATTHYADTVQVDGSDITPEWLGGAPTDGGGSGTFDIYSYTIIKTADATFKVFGSVSTYE